MPIYKCHTPINGQLGAKHKEKVSNLVVLLFDASELRHLETFWSSMY